MCCWLRLRLRLRWLRLLLRYDVVEAEFDVVVDKEGTAYRLAVA